jgi:hypothetical protein
MERFICPNMDTCALVNKPGFTGNEALKKKYMKDYCHASESRRNRCKRLIMKNTYHFCPDFVLPDTALTPDEIITKFDDENFNNN